MSASSELAPTSRKLKWATAVNAFAVSAAIAVVAKLFLPSWLDAFRRVEIPPHLSNLEAVIEPELIPHAIGRELINLVKEMRNYTSNVDQTKAAGFKPLHEHIGEAIPIGDDGTCSHRYLFPNADRTTCILPQRVDVGKHFIATGGLDGTKEFYEDMVNRVSSFGKYNFIEELDKFPPVKKLFESSKFTSAAQKICPEGQKLLDPFQFNFIVQVPGQTVALHTDAPYFWGASRFQFPQWLLVVMVFSNLFTDKFIHQVQVVGYLHEWSPTNHSGGEQIDESEEVGGDFVFFSNSTSFTRVLPEPFSGSLIDGSKMIHAAKVYKPSTKAPRMDKDKDVKLVFTGSSSEDDTWEVQSNGVKDIDLLTEDLRISIVYRARCFKDLEEKQFYYSQQSNATHFMDLEAILRALKDDLVDRSIISRSRIEKMDRLELSFFLMDSYIKYPFPPSELALIPYNYCALAKLFPLTKPLLRSFCR